MSDLMEWEWTEHGGRATRFLVATVISAPMIMIDEMALVTAISGVCKLCDTFQIT
jgi:hypothetical protein